MICLLARLRIGVASHWSVGVVVEGRMTRASMRLPDPWAAFYKRWSGVSNRLLKGAFSFLSAHLHVPGKWDSEDLPVGDS
jgi:hypothetical protein